MRTRGSQLMRVMTVLVASLGASASLFGDEGVSIPWSEFKSLYRESVEREIMQQAARPEKKPQVYSIDEARYALNVGPEAARGEALLSGTVVSGEPEPIPLFGTEAIITDIKTVAGGTVLCGQDTSRIAFLPDGPQQEFQITVGFLVRPQPDGQTQSLSLGIPHALQNALNLTLPPGSRVVAVPGIADAGGVYHFAPSDILTVKYFDQKALAATAAIEVDTFSRLRVEENRVVVTTSFVPIRTSPVPLILTVPEGAEYVFASPQKPWVKKREGNQSELAFPADEADEKGPFSIEWALPTAPDAGEMAVMLPVIEGNTGRQGCFLVEEPDDGQVVVTGKGLVTQIPVNRLGEGLSKVAGDGGFYMTISPNEPVSLRLTRFQSVSTPTTVLECESLFCSFEENGDILSVLTMDVPPEAGPRLKLKAVPDSTIWSLTVNDAKKSVFAGDEDTWIVPLATGQVSHVELAFLRKGARLGLQGRLEMLAPETGLPSRELRVGLGLPARVEMLSVEGPVSAADGGSWKRPAEFTGTPYFFACSFYKGEGMKLSISYKEPANPPQH